MSVNGVLKGVTEEVIMKKLLMSLMVVGVLVSAPSLCGEEKGPWTLGKVTVDKLNRSLTGGLDSKELRENHIGWVQIIKDVFGNNEVWTDSLPDVSFHGKFPDKEKKEDGSGAARYCPIQCKFLGLDWNGGHGQAGSFNSDIGPLLGEYGSEHYSHCGCTDIKARKAAGVFIDYKGGDILYPMIGDSVTSIFVALRRGAWDRGKACSAVGQNQWEFDESHEVYDDDDPVVVYCKRTKAAQEKIQQETQETVDKLMEPVKALQKK